MSNFPKLVTIQAENINDLAKLNQQLINLQTTSQQIIHINNGNKLKSFITMHKASDCYLDTLSTISWQPISDQKNKKIFLFTGQGSQYINMGLDLYQKNQMFKDHLDEAVTAINKHTDINLFDILFPKDNKSELINQTEYTQPSLFAIEYALAKTWIYAGVQPDLVMGHSVGEFAAATIANAISLETGAALISNRARLMQSLPAGGAMAALMTDLHTTEEILKSLTQYQHLNVAAINAPKQTVISGEARALEHCISIAKNQKIKARQLVVSHAFHSSLMQPILDDFYAIAIQYKMSSPTINLISNLTGKPITETITAKYWCDHIINPVNFLDSINNCIVDNPIFIEIGPNPVLTGMAKKCLPNIDAHWTYSLNQKESNSTEILLNNIGKCLSL